LPLLYLRILAAITLAFGSTSLEAPAMESPLPLPTATLDCIAPPPGPPPEVRLISPADNSVLDASKPLIVTIALADGYPPSSAELWILERNGSVAQKDPFVLGVHRYASERRGPALISMSAVARGLERGYSYGLTAHITQYTNLPRKCQKQFYLPVGAVRTK